MGCGTAETAALFEHADALLGERPHATVHPAALLPLMALIPVVRGALVDVLLVQLLETADLACAEWRSGFRGSVGARGRVGAEGRVGAWGRVSGLELGPGLGLGLGLGLKRPISADLCRGVGFDLTLIPNPFTNLGSRA